jgi:hypothetical protein
VRLGIGGLSADHEWKQVETNTWNLLLVACVGFLARACLSHVLPALSWSAVLRVWSPSAAPGELARNAHSQHPWPRPTKSETVTVGPEIRVLAGLLAYSDVQYSLRTTVLYLYV